MEMIKKLGTRLNKTGKSSAGWGLFRCPECRKAVEKIQAAGRGAFSCGCLISHHGMAGTVLYKRWGGMKTQSKKEGLMIYPQWVKFEGFQSWALANGYGPRMILRRENTSIGFSPRNCFYIRQKR